MKSFRSLPKTIKFPENFLQRFQESFELKSVTEMVYSDPDKITTSITDDGPPIDFWSLRFS